MRSNVTIKFKNNENSDFKVYALELREALSAPYRAEVSLLSKRRFSPSELSELTLEKEVSLRIEWQSNGKTVRRYLNGIITAARHNGLQTASPVWGDFDGEKVCSSFSLVIEPHLVLLRCAGRTCDYSNTTPLETVKKVLWRHKITPVVDSKYSAPEKYSGNMRFIQNGETDFDFITRIMKRYGIAYSFSHSAFSDDSGETGETDLYLSDGETFPAGSTIEFSGFPQESASVLNSEKLSMIFPFDMKELRPDSGIWKMDHFSASDSIGVEQVRFGTLLPGSHQRIVCEKGKNSVRKLELYDMPHGYSKNIGEDTLKQDLQRAADACECALNLQKQNWTGEASIPLIMPGAVLQISSFYSEESTDKLPVCVSASQLSFTKDEQSDDTSALKISFNCFDFSDKNIEKRFCVAEKLEKSLSALREAVVCDMDGRTDAEETFGRIVPSLNTSPEMPYLFMVRNEFAEPGENAVIDVEMTMPLGGKNSGLYRFPRVGDRVLVQFESDRAFLAGYVPDSTAPFSEFTESGDQYTRDSALLRYTAPGDTKTVGHPSEIGFSHFKSAVDFIEQKIIDGSVLNWLVSEAVLRNDLVLMTETTDLYAEELKTLRDNYFANPDSQNLEAIRTLAQTLSEKFELENHPACTGDSLHLVSNGVIIQHSEKGIDISSAETINIAAKNINIAADNSLNLQSEGVVRMASNASSVTVNPNGIAARALKLVDTVTPYDSAIYIGALPGVTVTGSKIKLNSLFSTKMSDAFGANVITAGAVTQISGALVDVATTAKDKLTEAMQEADKNSGLNTINEVLTTWKSGTTPDGAPRSIADHGITAGSPIFSPNATTLPPAGNYRTTAANVVGGMENATGVVNDTEYLLDASGSTGKEEFLATRLASKPGLPSITVRELFRARAFADQLNPHIDSIKSTVSAVQDANSASVSLFGHQLTINTKYINDLSSEKFSDAADDAGKK